MRWPYAILLLLPLVLLWRCFLAGEAIGPWAEVRTFAPWGEAPPARPFDVLQMDAALQFHPWRELVFSEWRAVRAPLWNPYSLGGTPLAANSQSGAFYPLHILLCWVPTSLAIALLAWIHLALFGIGVALLGQKTTGSQWAGVLSGAGAMTAAFLPHWIPLASVPTTIAWIPWLLLGTLRLLESSPWRGTAGIGLAGGMMLLGGHLQFALYGFIAAMTVALALAIRERKAVILVQSAVGLVLAGALAAPHLALVLEFSQFSHRRGPATAEGWASYSRSAIQPWELPGVVSAAAYGDMQRFSVQPLPAYWPAFVKAGAHPAESALFLGPLVLLGLALLRRDTLRDAAPGLALATIGVLLATPSPLAQTLYFGLPGFSATGSPGRAWILVVIGAAWASAAGWKRTTPDEKVQRRDLYISLSGVVGLSVVTGTLVASALPGALAPIYNLPEEILNAVRRSTILWPEQLVFVATGGLVLAALRLRQPSLRGAACAVPMLLWLGLVRTGDPPKFLPEDPLAWWSQPVNDSWGLLTLPTKVTMPGNLNILARSRQLTGYDSLIHRDTVALLRELNGGQDPAPPENGNMMFLKSNHDRSALARLGFNPEMKSELGGTLNGTPTLVAEPWPGRLIASVRPGGGRLRVHVRNLPGWRTNDPNLKVSDQGPWIEVEVPPDTRARTVSLSYAPSLQPLWLTLLGLLAVGALLRVTGGARAETASS